MKKIIAVPLLALACFIAPTTASAETTSGSIGINGGTLSLKNAPSTILFPELETDGFNHKSTVATIPTLRIQDGRGTGEGWNLTVSATQIKEVGGAGLVLPKRSLYMYQAKSLTPVGNTGTTLPPTIQLGNGYIDETPMTVAGASVNRGMGTYDLAFVQNSLEINVGPDVKVADREHYPVGPTPYQTTITWTLNNTP